MAIIINVQGNTRQVEASLSGLGIGMQRTATVRALNRAIDAAGTRANRGMRERYNLKRAAIDKAMRKTYASAAQPVPSAEIVVSGKRISLYEFGARVRGKGAKREITVALRKDRGREVVRGRAGLVGKPFVAKVSGPVAIWQRVGRARFPVKQVKGPSLPYVFVRKQLQRALEQVAAEVFEKNLKQQVRFLAGAR